MRRGCALAAGLVLGLTLLAGCSEGSRSGASKRSSPPSTRSNGRVKKRRPAVPRPDGHGAVVVVPSSIIADCSADVTSVLQSWLDSTPDNVRLMLRRGACFRIEGTLKLVDRNDLVLDGLGATLKATTPGSGGRLQVRARSQVNIVGSHN